MVEIFKTDVETVEQARNLLALLLGQVPGAEINFDLEDCDRILRVKGADLCCDPIIQTLKANGHQCFRLD